MQKSYKQDFPIFQEYPELVYLDSAATTQRPQVVIDKIKEFYEKQNANTHRGLYKLSEVATEEYEKARQKIADLLNAFKEEIVFTKGTTNSINILSYTLKSILRPEKSEIVLTEMEHHSNLVPWQQFAKKHGYKLSFIKVNPKTFELDLEDAKHKITEKTGIVSITHASNSLGTINDIQKIIHIAKQNNAIIIIDAAQSITSLKLDVKELDCDFLVFSGHKMFAPFGIGVLYGKKQILEKLSPFEFGGEMISHVSYEESEWNDIPFKFEAGTQNVGGAIALGEAVDYINKIGLNKIQEHKQALLKYTFNKLKEIKNIEFYSPEENNIGIISFNLKSSHSHDIAYLLNNYNICIRAGHHCCMPLMGKLGIPGTCRISFSIYNEKEDIDKLVNALIKINEKFEKR